MQTLLNCALVGVLSSWMPSSTNANTQVEFDAHRFIQYSDVMNDFQSQFE